jgi:hypothetical protein
MAFCGGKDLNRTNRRLVAKRSRRFEAKNGYVFGDDLYYQSMLKKGERVNWESIHPDKFRSIMDKMDVPEQAAENKIYQRQEQRAVEVRAREKLNKVKTRLRNKDRDFKSELI